MFSSQKLSRIPNPSSLEPWRPRDARRAERRPPRRAARGSRPGVQPSAAPRRAARSVVPAGASPRRVATMMPRKVRLHGWQCDRMLQSRSCVLVSVLLGPVEVSVFSVRFTPHFQNTEIAFATRFCMVWFPERPSCVLWLHRVRPNVQISADRVVARFVRA